MMAGGQNVAYSDEEEDQPLVDTPDTLTGLEEVPTLSAVPRPHVPHAKERSPLARAVHEHPTGALLLGVGLALGGAVLGKHFLGFEKQPKTAGPKPTPPPSSQLPTAVPRPNRAAIPRASSTPRIDPREAAERAPEPEGAAKYPPVAPWRRSGLDGSASRGNLVGLSTAGSGSGVSDNDSDTGAQPRRRQSVLVNREREAPPSVLPSVAARRVAAGPAPAAAKTAESAVPADHAAPAVKVAAPRARLVLEDGTLPVMKAVTAAPPADRYASLEAAFTAAIVPELPSGLPDARMAISTSIADILAAQYGGKPVEHVGPLAPTGPPPQPKLRNWDEEAEELHGSYPQPNPASQAPVSNHSSAPSWHQPAASTSTFPLSARTPPRESSEGTRARDWALDNAFIEATVPEVPDDLPGRADSVASSIAGLLHGVSGASIEPGSTAAAGTPTPPQISESEAASRRAAAAAADAVLASAFPLKSRSAVVGASDASGSGGGSALRTPRNAIPLESPSRSREASVDAAWTQAVVPELPSGLREDRNTVATNIADLIREYSGSVSSRGGSLAASPAVSRGPSTDASPMRAAPATARPWSAERHHHGGPKSARGSRERRTALDAHAASRGHRGSRKGRHWDAAVPADAATLPDAAPRTPPRAAAGTGADETTEHGGVGGVQPGRSPNFRLNPTAPAFAPRSGPVSPAAKWSAADDAVGDLPKQQKEEAAEDAGAASAKRQASRALPDHPSKRTQTEGGKFLVAAEQQGDSSAATEAEAVAAAALSVAEGDAPAHEPPHSKEVAAPSNEASERGDDSDADKRRFSLTKQPRAPVDTNTFALHVAPIVKSASRSSALGSLASGAAGGGGSSVGSRSGANLEGLLDKKESSSSASVSGPEPAEAPRLRETAAAAPSSTGSAEPELRRGPPEGQQAESEAPSAVATQAALSVSDSLSSSDVSSSPRSSMGISSSDGDDDAEAGSAAHGDSTPPQGVPAMQPAKSDFAAESANVSAAVLAATAAADDSESAAPAPGPEAPSRDPQPAAVPAVPQTPFAEEATQTAPPPPRPAEVPAEHPEPPTDDAEPSAAEGRAALEKADALIKRGLEVFNRGQPEQAEKLQRQAISTLRKGGAGGRALARGYSGLADIVYQSSSRRAPEALQHLRTAVAELEAEDPERLRGHSSFCNKIQHNLASLYQEQGDLEAVVQTYAAAARAAVALYGEGTRWATASRWKEANALSQLGRQREAVDLLRGAAKRCTAEAERLEQDPDARAAAVGDTVSATNAEVELGPQQVPEEIADPVTRCRHAAAVARLHEGKLHERSGDARRAEAALRAAKEEGERAFGRGAQPTIVFIAALALHLRVSDDMGKRGEAAALYEGMVSAMQKARVGDHQVAALLLKLSEVYGDLGRHEDAVASAERALALIKGLSGVLSYEHIEPFYARAAAAKEQAGDREGAHELRKKMLHHKQRR